VISFKGRHHQQDMILQCVRWYVAYSPRTGGVAGVNCLTLVESQPFAAETSYVCDRRTQRNETICNAVEWVADSADHGPFDRV
jgi:hypothetical protein